MLKVLRYRSIALLYFTYFLIGRLICNFQGGHDSICCHEIVSAVMKKKICTLFQLVFMTPFQWHCVQAIKNKAAQSSPRAKILCKTL